MKNVKLKIEAKKNTKNSDTISFFADKKKYIKDKTKLRNILKEKLKDRHRIKGICFSNSKIKPKNTYILKKDISSDLLDIDEANYLKSMNEYEKLKHEIYLKEIKEKKIENFDTDLLKKEINYTNLRETIYQFLRFKKTSNLYKANILKNKIELKLANKISKKNFINKTLKSVILHFNNVKGRIDLGKKPLEETENEYAYKKIFEQIAKSRIKYMNKLKNENAQSSNNKTKHGNRKSFIIFNSEEGNKDNNLMELLNNNLTENHNIENENFQSEVNEEKNESNNKSFNKNENNNNNQKIINKNFGNISKTELNEIDNINKNKDNNYIKKKYKNKRKKKEKNHKYILSEKKLKFNNNDVFNENGNGSRTQRITHFKYKTHNKKLQIDNHFQTYQDNSDLIKLINNQNNLKNNGFNNYEMNQRLEIFEDNINNKKVLNENINNQKGNLNNCIGSSTNSKQFVKELNYLDKMKKNYLIVTSRTKNPNFWNNNNKKRIQTAGFRTISNKVINKPFYTTKIGDLVKEYNRIKRVSNKSRIRMRERCLTTVNDINKIVKIKEDLLMFNLKLKYFNCTFQNKKIKTIPKNKIIRNKVVNCFEITDNPFNLDGNESSKENLI